jgi:putative FmdB family regulatory protein
VPTYSYACTACEHHFDTVQKFTDSSLTDCPECSGRLRKLFSSVGIVFKGSGFYRNDSRASSSAQSGSAQSGSDKSESTQSGSSESSSNGKPEPGSHGKSGSHDKSKPSPSGSQSESASSSSASSSATSATS